LDAPRRAAPFGVKFRFASVFLFLLSLSSGAPASQDSGRLQSVKRLYQQEKWEEVLREARGSEDQSAEFDYYAGMALSHLERWNEAKAAFSKGAGKDPGDPRFLTERAGADYKLNDFKAAKRDLRRALPLAPDDPYIREFLGTIYLLEGNVEAALKYWGTLDKPRLAAVEAVPQVRTQKKLLDRAVEFAPPGVLSRDSYVKTNAVVENLQVFPQWRVEIQPAGEDEYQATLRMNERNGFGSSPMDGLMSLLRGLPYETIYPSYYNIRGEAMNFDSLARWDPEKRRVTAGFSMPLFRQPAKRLRFFFDARNENWNLSRTFSGGPAAITDLNMKRFAGGAELHVIEAARWDLTAGVEGTSRSFQNVPAGLPNSAAPFFTGSRGVDAWLDVHRLLIRVPERRFTLDGTAEIRAGRNYQTGLGAFSSTRGELKSRWLPKARGEDYEFLCQLRGGSTVGDVGLDELYQLGVERDNDLSMRGHSGVLDGRKGQAPLGRRYVLLNSELNKTVYDGAFFRVQLGPFFDTGAIADPSGLVGSQKWLFDTGIQARIRVLGTVSVVLSYGRDVANGTGAFYGTSFR
jgi:tetratricopeptide (TPR) repeat protein